MQDLRIILIILGAVAIAALLIHGLWTSQKGRQKTIREKPMGKLDSQAVEHTTGKAGEFDSDGIGQVRVAGSNKAASFSQKDEKEVIADEIEDDWQISSSFSATRDDDSFEPSIDLPPTLSKSVFAEDEEPLVNKDDAEPELSTTANDGAELRARQYHLGEIDPLFDTPEAEKEAMSVQASADTTSEPVVHDQDADDQGADESDDFALEQIEMPAEVAAEPESKSTAPPEATITRPLRQVPKTWQDVYVVNLMARPNQSFAGTDLIRALTDADFSFGEMDIFHRHQGGSSQGEILFSLANMVNPGTFNPNAMSEFTSPGVSIFMQLPRPGMAKNQFNLMVQAAENIAEDLQALVLDAERRPLSPDYLARCREQLRDFDSQAE